MYEWEIYYHNAQVWLISQSDLCFIDFRVLKPYGHAYVSLSLVSKNFWFEVACILIGNLLLATIELRSSDRKAPCQSTHCQSISDCPSNTECRGMVPFFHPQ